LRRGSQHISIKTSSARFWTNLFRALKSVLNSPEKIFAASLGALTHAVKLLEELYAEMHKYLVGLNKISLVGLSKTTSYTEANYAGPSGLNIPELLDLRELLKDKTTEALLTNEDTCDRRETTREGRKPCRQGSRRSRPARLRHSRQGEGGNAGTHCSVQPRSTRCPQPAGPTSNKPETADTQLTSVRSGQQRMA
jgi:hypothetical protein